MAIVKLFRETALPQTLETNSIYLIAPPSKPDYLEIYVVGNTTSSVRRVITKDDVQAMIDASQSGASEITIVDTIADRDALNPTKNMFVLVLDASDDPTVDSGSASYVYRASTQQWIKIAEYESMDVVVQWSQIQGKPNSTPEDIDDAVAKRHTHANMTQLNKIGEDANGYLTYNGNYPKIAWDSTSW
ncbi:MAG: hypothetical protein QXW35_04990 [Candidatus Aenigmatarchaeota archaeon]